MGKYILLSMFFVTLQSCTLSFTNVMTSGESSDVVDSDPYTDSDIDADISIPLSKI